MMGMTYEIQYKQGKENFVADALSWATHGEVLMMSISNVSTELGDLLGQEWVQDSKLIELIRQMHMQPQAHPKYKWAEGMLTRKRKIVVGST